MTKAGAEDLERDQLAGLLTQVPAAMVVIDKSKRLVAASDQWLTDHGLHGPHVLGGQYHEVFPDAPPQFENSIDRAIAGQPSRSNEIRVTYPDGQTRWLSWDATPWYGPDDTIAGVIVTTKDITQQRLAELADFETEIRFHEIFQHAPIGIAFNDWSGRLELCNPAYCNMLGYTADELQGRAIAELVHPKDLAEDMALTKQLRTGKRQSYDVENRYIAHDGNPVYVHKHVSLLPGRNGRGSRMVALVTDMTRHRAEREEIGRVRRMESIGRLASGIAHDSNHLFAVISGNLELGLRHVENERARELIRNSLHAVEIGSAFNKRLLSMAGQRNYTPRVLDLNKQVRNTYAILHQIVGEKVVLDLDLDEDLRPTRVDPGEVDSALLNLVTNARDALPEGGQILIETRNVQAPPNHHLPDGGDDPNPHVRLSVSDNGHGMTDEVRKKARDPFFTTKSPHRGTGLGLSSVFSFVERAGGRVDIESNPGDGTSVHISLPVHGHSAR